MTKIETIVKSILTSNNKINHRKLKHLKDSYPLCYNYLSVYFDDSESIEETINRVVYNVDVRPICKTCGGRVKWYGKNRYALHCCTKCASLDVSVKEKKLCTTKERYGVSYITQTEHFKEQSKRICLSKYGKEYYTQTDEQKLKSKESKTERYGSSDYNNIEKANATKLSRYGVKFNNRDKARKTCLEKYGVENPYLIKEVKENAGSKESQHKRWQTLKQNGTTNSSKTEDNLYIELKKFFPDIIRQYWSEKYPFNCDFYIPSKDLYIEFQGGHFHQYHPFDRNNKNDIDLLRKFEEKVSLPQYKQIIHVWTKVDPLKRSVAKENCINFLEIWPDYNISEIVEKILNF